MEWFLAHSKLPMGVNSYYYVQKLLHCFSIKVNHTLLGITLFQKLEELVESLCLTWDNLSLWLKGRPGCLLVPLLPLPTIT